MAIPSNDDSIDLVVLINDIFSEYILVKKLWTILRWFYYVACKTNRFIFFEKWVSSRLNSKIKISNKNLFSKNLVGLAFFISRYDLYLVLIVNLYLCWKV